MNPRKYCAEHRIKTSEFIRRVQEVAPKYSKSTNSMVNNVDYGVMLRPFVVRYIRGKPENRRNPCRVQFRVTAAQRARLTRAMDVLSCATVQDFMTFVLNGFLERLEKETAALSGPEDSGKDLTHEHDTTE